MRTFLVVPVIFAMALPAFAQSGSSPAQPRGTGAENAGLATPTGHELNFNLSSYTYKEPGDTSISIHGPKVGGEYRGTMSLGQARRWFARANARGLFGNATYDGWCFPFLIRPNNTSPNGYELDLGDPSPCSETGDRDWYVETSGVVGKDIVGQAWGFSPYAGLGFRHLSNGTAGVPGYRTDNYLYLPLGMTARTLVGSHRSLEFTFEYDQLLHGWQTTRDSELGGGDFPATPTAPAFTLNGFTDISFAQHGGFALRAAAKYQVTRRWSVEPSYVYWHVSASPVNYETATFTVNNVSANEQWGAYEPLNATHEFSVKFGFHF